MIPDEQAQRKVMDFLRPITEGGMGGGDRAWISYCLGLGAKQSQRVFDELLKKGMLIEWFDGSLRRGDIQQLKGQPIKPCGPCVPMKQAALPLLGVGRG